MKKILIILFLLVLTGCAKNFSYKVTITLDTDVDLNIHTSADSYNYIENKLILYTKTINPISVSLEKEGYQSVNFIISSEDIVNKNFEKTVSFGQAKVTYLELSIKTTADLDNVEFVGIDLTYKNGMFIGEINKNEACSFWVNVGNDYKSAKISISKEESNQSFIYKEVIITKTDENALIFRYPYGRVNISILNPASQARKYTLSNGEYYIVPENIIVGYTISGGNTKYFKSTNDYEIMCNKVVTNATYIRHRFTGFFIQTISSKLYYEYNHKLFKIDNTFSVNLPAGGKIAYIEEKNHGFEINYLKDIPVFLEQIYLDETSFHDSQIMEFDFRVYDLANKKYLSSIKNKGAVIESQDDVFKKQSYFEFDDYIIMNDDVFMDMLVKNGSRYVDLYVLPKDIKYAARFVDYEGKPLDNLTFNTTANYLNEGLYTFPHMHLSNLGGALVVPNFYLGESIKIVTNNRTLNNSSALIIDDMFLENIDGVDYFVYNKTLSVDLRTNNLKIKYESSQASQSQIDLALSTTYISIDNRVTFEPLSISLNSLYVNNLFVGDTIFLSYYYNTNKQVQIKVTEEMMSAEFIYLDLDSSKYRIE